MKTKLSAAQIKAWNEIKTAAVSMPNKWYGGTFKCESDYVSESGSKWAGGMVYGMFNTKTIQAIESAGLIKIHRVGGSFGDDEIEVI